MNNFWRCVWGALGRIWPDCVTTAQAVAFNMFLAFFPMLLLLLGLVSQWDFLRSGVEDMFGSLGPLMPPGMSQVLADFLARHADNPLSWASVGLVGTLLAGTQMMRLLIQGFHIAGRIEGPGTLEQILRALALLCMTFIPTVLAVAITVFGKQMRIAVTLQFGSPVFIRVLFAVATTIIALLLAMLVLAIVYRVGTRDVRGWREVMPGAVIATPLWWFASWAFGIYMRHVPYNLVYGGLATAIGVMIWMNFTVVIILFGSAYNAEYTLLRRSVEDGVGVVNAARASA
jgi:membrane protein